MYKIKVGHKVRIRSKPDWVNPPGFRFGNAEGTVIRWSLDDALMENFKDFAYIRVEKAEGDGKVYTGDTLMFRVEDLEKI